MYVVHIAHKRGIHAIGGASNYIPRMHYPKATMIAKEQNIEEKLNEAKIGFDGGWIVHPMLVETINKCYHLVAPNVLNQKHKLADAAS